MSDEVEQTETPEVSSDETVESPRIPFKERKVVKFLGTAWGRIAACLTIITLLGGSYYLFLQLIADVDKSHLDGRKFRILVPLQSNTGEYLDYIQPNSKSSADDLNKFPFSSKVSRNIRDTINATRNSWFLGSDRFLTKDKIDFYFFPEGYDKKSFADSYERALTDAMKDDREIVALVGNVSSSSTLEYARLAGNEKIGNKLMENRTKDGSVKIDGRVPMILPLATSTSLTNNLRVEGVPSFLRFPPANDKQARFIAKFLLTSQPNALNSILVKDLTNKTWSEDLVESFRNEYVQEPLKVYEEHRVLYPKIEANFGRILAVPSIGGEFSSPFLYPSITALKPDALVIFGMTNGSLETLAQAKASDLKFKYIILTDGAVDEYLITRIVTLVDPEQIKRVRLSFPLPCSMPNELKSILSNVDKMEKGSQPNYRDFDMTHSLFVSDSVFTLLYVLENQLKQGNKKPAREIISEIINKWKDDAKDGEKAIDVIFPDSKRKYKIDQLGNTTNLDYHLFRIEFEEVNEEKIPLWKHDEECPHDKKLEWQVTC